MEGQEAKAIWAEVTRQAELPLPNKTVLAGRLCLLWGSLHRAHAPSPPPPVGGQSCWHWGQEPGPRGAVTHCGHCMALATSCPSCGAPGGLDWVGWGEGASTLPSPLLGFSALRSEGTGTRGIRVQLLVAHSSDRPPARGRRDVASSPALVLAQHRFWESPPKPALQNQWRGGGAALWRH